MLKIINSSRASDSGFATWAVTLTEFRAPLPNLIFGTSITGFKGRQPSSVCARRANERNCGIRWQGGENGTGREAERRQPLPRCRRDALRASGHGRIRRAKDEKDARSPLAMSPGRDNGLCKNLALLKIEHLQARGFCSLPGQTVQTSRSCPGDVQYSSFPLVKNGRLTVLITSIFFMLGYAVSWEQYSAS